MTRKELIENLGKKHNQYSYKFIESTTKHILDVMAKALGKGRRIEIRNFGSFSVKLRSSRSARNPKTGETLRIPNKYSIYFKPGKELKQRVNL